MVSFRGSRYAVHRGPRRFWVGGVWRTLVGLSVLGTVYYGTSHYYPYGYVSVARPYCGGVNDDGCTLTWRDVPTEDGGAMAQCVQYCPQGVTPVAVSISSAGQAAPPRTGNEDGCEVKGFSEPELGGESFTTGDNYPTMDEWKQQVASLQVVSGTWDFFSDENYGGETIRLAPGVYRTLGENWSQQISSFMCVDPAGGEAPQGASAPGPGGPPPGQGGPPPGPGSR